MGLRRPAPDAAGAAEQGAALPLDRRRPLSKRTRLVVTSEPRSPLEPGDPYKRGGGRCLAGDMKMRAATAVLCCGIIVADHVCTPVSHLPAAGELVLAERILLTIGGCAANVAVDLAKMEAPPAVVGPGGGRGYGRARADSLPGDRGRVAPLRA